MNKQVIQADGKRGEMEKRKNKKRKEKILYEEILTYATR